MRTEQFEINGCSIDVHYMWEYPTECGMCGQVICDSVIHAVPWYCGPVMEGCSEDGYRSVCKSCFDKWEAWNDMMMYQGA